MHARRRVQAIRRRACALWIIAAATALLAGCAALPPAQENATPARDVAFSIDGRLSARHGDQGIAGAFSWSHTPGRDSIDIATPWRQTLAELGGDATGVRLRTPEGKTDAAPDWSTLTERAFGVRIPVEGLAYWIRGEASDASTAHIERDARGRAKLLHQNGWDIDYAYHDDSAPLPDRVTLHYPGTPPIDLRVVVDRWQ